MPKVSTEHKDAVRRRIMDGALACLQRSGYQDITTRELLAEVGLSTGTFYNYFDSKEQLYEALAEEALANDLARLSASDQPVGFNLFGFLSEYMMVEPEGAVAVASFRSGATATPNGAEAVARLNRYVVEQFVPLVQKAQADGYVDPDIDADALVELMDIIWDGLGRRAGSDSFETSYQRVGAACLQVLARGALTAGAELPGSTPR